MTDIDLYVNFPQLGLVHEMIPVARIVGVEPYVQDPEGKPKPHFKTTVTYLSGLGEALTWHTSREISELLMALGKHQIAQNSAQSANKALDHIQKLREVSPDMFWTF